MTRLLLIALLVGTPRDIANRPSKHYAELPPLPVAKPFRALAKVPPSTVTVTLFLDNPNPTVQRWVIESSPNVKSPTWAALTNGIVAANGSVSVVVGHQRPYQFYRAGFVWP